MDLQPGHVIKLTPSKVVVESLPETSQKSNPISFLYPRSIDLKNSMVSIAFMLKANFGTGFWAKMIFDLNESRIDVKSSNQISIVCVQDYVWSTIGHIVYVF